MIVLLISLMKDQVSNLNCRGIRASYIGDDRSEEQLEDILNLKEKRVFGSPKAILNNSEFTLENTCSGVKFFGKNVCSEFYLRQLIFADPWKNRKKLNPHKFCAT